MGFIGEGKWQGCRAIMAALMLIFSLKYSCALRKKKQTYIVQRHGILALKSQAMTVILASPEHPQICIPIASLEDDQRMSGN